ncbi:tRNA1(Val) (adenine(37)-N6)-methyltransferase [Gluconacetobacter tumulicola]|uniref:tRNA1(Val) (adenine(37)-N6)-methyltransferase n=1 Tax=Gluconacetobacter tumulicola TaxID=1017177 RepID=UPI001FE2663E|nr:methyltransferase [Gluconacetobacter tumulicola]
MTVKPKDIIHEPTPDLACPADDASIEALSHGTLLDGRLRYRQFRHGYRTGLEPVLMAASIPARPGQRILEGGCGAGAGLMCLAWRVAGTTGVGVERDARTAMLAQANFNENGFDRLRALCATLPDLPPLPECPAQGGGFDHAFANPPWHRADASASPDPRRDIARRVGTSDMLNVWVRSLGRQVRHHGTLTLALPAASLDTAIAAMRAHGIGSIRLIPFWPKAGRPARIVLVQGRVGGRGDAALLPGMTLHRADGHFTPEAEAILRDGAPLDGISS